MSTAKILRFVVIHDPSECCPFKGSSFSDMEVDLGIKHGHWPEGMIFRRRGVTFEVIGPELQEQRLVVVPT